MSAFNFVYITTKDKDEAKKIGKALLEERLVACVNIIDNMNSLYWWEGAIQDDNETILIAKTKGSLVSEVIEKVKSLQTECQMLLNRLQVYGYHIDTNKTMGQIRINGLLLIE